VKRLGFYVRKTSESGKVAYFNKVDRCWYYTRKYATIYRAAKTVRVLLGSLPKNATYDVFERLEDGSDRLLVITHSMGSVE
jgi:aminoglycoside/choline kinase family phosphotransferase